MEGGNVGVGPATSNSRPVRSSSRYFFGSHPANFTGPVRRWQKKWVHVAPSQPSTTRTTRSKPQSNAHRSLNSPVLLCKWTPLPPPTTTTTTTTTTEPAVNGGSPRRKFRYAPIAVIEEKKKLTAKTATNQNLAETTRLSGETPAKDSDQSHGMLDINNDITESDQGTSKSRPVHYSRRSQLKKSRS